MLPDITEEIVRAPGSVPTCLIGVMRVGASWPVGSVQYLLTRRMGSSEVCEDIVQMHGHGNQAQ